MNKPVRPITLADVLYKNIFVSKYVVNNVLSVYELWYINDTIRNGKLNLHEIPVKKLSTDILISGIEETLYTCNTQETINYIINNTFLSLDNIIPYYIQDKDIAMCIMVYFEYKNITHEQLEDICKLFKECGYYLLYNEIINDSGIHYMKMYFEPYKTDYPIFRIPSNLYYFTNIIDINEQYLNKTDNITIFHLGKNVNEFISQIKSNNISIVYKVNIPDDKTYFIDSRMLLENGIIKNDIIYSYDNILSSNIINKIDLNKYK